MCLTAYEGEEVEDKIRHGLNNEMALEWAKIPRKPPTVGEQLALLRGMGHAVSLFHILKTRLPVRPISNGSEMRSELGFVYQANQIR